MCACVWPAGLSCGAVLCCALCMACLAQRFRKRRMLSRRMLSRRPWSQALWPVLPLPLPPLPTPAPVSPAATPGGPTPEPGRHGDAGPRSPVVPSTRRPGGVAQGWGRAAASAVGVHKQVGGTRGVGPAVKGRLEHVGALALQLGSMVGLLAEADPAAVRDVLEVLEVLDAPAEPALEKNAGPDAVGDENKHAGERVLLELAEKGVVERGASVVDVGGALAVRNSVEEVAVLGPLQPDLPHLLRRALEVAEVLLPHAGLLVDDDLAAAAAGGGGGLSAGGLSGVAVAGRVAVVVVAVVDAVGGVDALQAPEDPLQRLPRALVRRREEADRLALVHVVVELDAGSKRLLPACRRQGDLVVRRVAVHGLVAVALGLAVADQQYELSQRGPPGSRRRRLLVSPVGVAKKGARRLPSRAGALAAATPPPVQVRTLGLPIASCSSR